MEGLTKEKALELHRKMWNYIADEGERQERIISKKEAFGHFGWPTVTNLCWCCKYAYEYAIEKYGFAKAIRMDQEDLCTKCAIKWNSTASAYMCQSSNDKELDLAYRDLRYIGTGLYDLWREAFDDGDWKKTAYYAKQIAELPENPNA